MHPEYGRLTLATAGLLFLLGDATQTRTCTRCVNVVRPSVHLSLSETVCKKDRNFQR